MLTGGGERASWNNEVEQCFYLRAQVVHVRWGFCDASGVLITILKNQQCLPVPTLGPLEMESYSFKPLNLYPPTVWEYCVAPTFTFVVFRVLNQRTWRLCNGTVLPSLHTHSNIGILFAFYEEFTSTKYCTTLAVIHNSKICLALANNSGQSFNKHSS